MSELSGLDLRRAACEALGIRIEECVPRWKIVGLESHMLRRYSFESSALSDLPPIESQASVSEPMFLEWCAKNGLAWVINSTISGEGHSEKISCQVWQPFLNQPNSQLIVSVLGATPSEARARAIVAAAKEPA